MERFWVEWLEESLDAHDYELVDRTTNQESS
jgi:hypothetical protein